MEPRIQYAKTADGVNVAFFAVGEGMPFIHMPWIPWSHIQLSWQRNRTRRWYEQLSEKRKLVAYDGRGTGLSDRDVSNLSLDAQALDLEAVADRLGLQRFALFGFGESGPVAIAYAARHPERVSHLVLWCAWARASDVWQVTRTQAFRAILATGDWQLMTEAMASETVGKLPVERAEQAAAFMRQCTSAETLQAFYSATYEADVTELLPEVSCPTLVLCPPTTPWMREDAPRRLAAEIPDARLAIIEGVHPRPYFGNTEAVLAAIDEFLSEGEEPPAAAELPEGMAVLLFTDIAESTALTEQLGDAAFRAKARQLDTSLRSVIKDSGGTPVEGKVLGDGVLAVFTSARQAIDCALRCEAAGEPLGLKLHLGIHAGDVIREGNNVYGGAVNIAARIAAASAPGEVLVSQTVRDLARTSAGVTFDDRGQRKLKGVEGRQRLFAVGGEADG